MQGPLDFALNALIFSSLALTGAMALISALYGLGRASMPPELRDCTIALIGATLFGYLAVLLAICSDFISNTSHPAQSFKMFGLTVGFAAFIIALVMHEIGSATPSDGVSPPSDVHPAAKALANKRPDPPPSLQRLPAVPIRTAMDDAHGVRNPVTAWTNRIATNAQIDALADAARLAQASATTAQAEAAGMDAILRRDEKFAEFHARQQFKGQLSDSKLSDQEEIVLDATHSRALAVKRREKETHEAERATLSAKYGVDAEKKFKSQKFALGKERARARIADAAVDRATADAAVSQLGGIPDTGTKSAARALNLVLADLKKRIIEGEASGHDTTALRTTLQSVEEIFAT